MFEDIEMSNEKRKKIESLVSEMDAAAEKFEQENPIPKGTLNNRWDRQYEAVKMPYVKKMVEVFNEPD